MVCVPIMTSNVAPANVSLLHDIAMTKRIMLTIRMNLIAPMPRTAHSIWLIIGQLVLKTNSNAKMRNVSIGIMYVTALKTVALTNRMKVAILQQHAKIHHAISVVNGYRMVRCVCTAISSITIKKNMQRYQ